MSSVGIIHDGSSGSAGVESGVGVGLAGGLGGGIGLAVGVGVCAASSANVAEMVVAP
jgi:hypothetical protein